MVFGDNDSRAAGHFVGWGRSSSALFCCVFQPVWLCPVWGMVSPTGSSRPYGAALIRGDWKWPFNSLLCCFKLFHVGHEVD